VVEEKEGTELLVGDFMAFSLLTDSRRRFQGRSAHLENLGTRVRCGETRAAQCPLLLSSTPASPLRRLRRRGWSICILYSSAARNHAFPKR